MCDNIRLINNDCIEAMKEIQDKSIDMILCDLPYGMTKNKWDSVISFEELWGEYNRIIKDDRAIVLFGQEPFSTKLRMSNFGMFRYDWIWYKKMPGQFLNAKKRPLASHEVISVFSKSKLGTLIYNPIMTKGVLRNKGTHGKISENYNKFGIKVNYNDNYYPRSVIEMSNTDHRNKIHPTQKPVNLCEYLIKTYSNEGDLILDNCMGSGSTGIACINTNRRFIGIELDTNIFELAKERIENHKKEKKKQ